MRYPEGGGGGRSLVVIVEWVSEMVAWGGDHLL